ncbi:MAG: beta-propeller fold lactonase family protein, partial [Chloroflexota bacterium]
IGDNGSLTPLADSAQPLSNHGVGAAPGPAQISFGSDGSTLVVTEKGTNSIDTYKVEGDIAGAPTTHASSGATPFGFAFDQHDHLIVSEAFGGAANASAVSSYFVHEDEFNTISPSVATTQTAACWIAISKNGKYAYTTNTGSGSISSYSIGADGSLTLLNPVAGSTGIGSGPVDMAFSNNGAYLYTLAGGAHTISIFQMSADGSLTSQGIISVPAGVVGLAAQ